MILYYTYLGSSGGVVVNLSASEQEVMGLIPILATKISEIGYLLQWWSSG